jgi:hypothetical protein
VVATAETVAEARGDGYEQLDRLVDANSARVLGW